MIIDFSHFTSTVLLAVGALLPIVDPLGGAPIFIGMTAGLTPAERVRMAKSVAINSFLLLIASVLIGAYVLDFFGISIPAVQIAGGVVICAIAWSLLNSPNSPPALAKEGPATVTADDLGQRAFYPLTMPLTAGPGAISVALTLGANPTKGLRPLVETTLGQALGILIVAVSVYLCYRYADRITKKMGPIGTGVVVRLSAFILLCIGVQICWNGLHTLIIATFPTAA
ncbi:MAG TPA: MarC family protein [Gallionella sp.]|nr:MarC family protein [Gallionella sp.]